MWTLFKALVTVKRNTADWVSELIRNYTLISLAVSEGGQSKIRVIASSTEILGRSFRNCVSFTHSSCRAKYCSTSPAVIHQEDDRCLSVFLCSTGKRCSYKHKLLLLQTRTAANSISEWDFRIAPNHSISEQNKRVSTRTEVLPHATTGDHWCLPLQRPDFH